MSAITYTVFLASTAIVFNPVPDTFASTIKTLEVPLVVRNGTGPIDLSCVYEIQENENGLVIKWYHDAVQIYQWIPPMPPQDVGVIEGFAEYPEKHLKRPNSQSIIRLSVITFEMGGEYTCSISTFQDEDSWRTRMIVYVPESNSTVQVSPFNETHLSLICEANGARPRPNLRFYVEGVAIDQDNRGEETDRQNSSSRRQAIVDNSFEPTLVECEISIPNTDYKRRERIVYYPSSNRSKLEEKDHV